MYLVKTHEIGHVNANNRLRAVPSVFDDVSIQNMNGAGALVLDTAFHYFIVVLLVCPPAIVL